jgi:2-phosphoglycerate kinase
MQDEAPVARLVDVRSALEHLVWIGGSPCAGKTTVAQQLADRFGFPVYHFDRHQVEHIRRSRSDLHPALHAFLTMTMDERWLLRPPTQMAQTVIQSWTERFGLVLADLLALPIDPPVIAEGAGVFPELVAPLLSSLHQAIWLVPTDACCEARRRRRGSAMPTRTSDPERAWRHLIDRDILLANYVKMHCEERGIPVIEIDEGMPLDDVVAAVAAHLDPWLSLLKDRRTTCGDPSPT